jgi:hypothetical protein
MDSELSSVGLDLSPRSDSVQVIDVGHKERMHGSGCDSCPESGSTGKDKRFASTEILR